MILLQYMYKQSIFNTKHCALQTNDLQINRKKELYHERKQEVKRAGPCVHFVIPKEEFSIFMNNNI